MIKNEMSQDPALRRTQKAIRDEQLYAINPQHFDHYYFAEYTPATPETIYPGEDLASAQKLASISDLAFRLCSRDFEPPLKKSTHYRKPFLEITPLGRKLIIFLADLSEGSHNSPHHELQPQIKTIIEIGNIATLKIHPDAVQHLTSHDFDVAVSEYNELALKMRKALLREGMREKIKSFHRNSKNCYNQILRSLQQRVDRHRKLLFIALVHGERRKFPHTHAHDIDQESFSAQAAVISARRRKMVKHLKSTFGKYLLFYAWKMEWGRCRGWHLHWFIVLNGTKYQDRINVPFHIARHWDLEICEGTTHTQSLNGMRSGENDGLRVMNYWEPDINFHSQRLARYLTKIDLTMKLRLPKGIRSFGCSKLLKPSNKSGPARIYAPACDLSDPIIDE